MLSRRCLCSIFFKRRIIFVSVYIHNGAFGFYIKICLNMSEHQKLMVYLFFQTTPEYSGIFIYKIFSCLQFMVSWNFHIFFFYIKILVQQGTWIRLVPSGDNKEKISLHWVLAKPKTIEGVSLGGVLSPPGGPVRCLDERVYANL